MPVLLSLLAALSYGFADFIGGLGSKRASPWSVALLSQLGGALSLAGFASLAGGSPTGQDLRWAVLAGLFGGLGTAYLYRGLGSGRMGVVSPVSGVGAVVIPGLVGLTLGERPSPAVWLGLAVALPGIWLVARVPDTPSASTRQPAGTGLPDGVLAGIGFGGMFAALAQISESAGFFPLVVTQLLGVAAVVLFATVLRAPWIPRDRATLRPALVTGLLAGSLGGLATGLFLAATHTGFLVVAAVLTSLYPAVTVLLAMTVLREHVHRSQAVGLGLCLACIALVAAG